MPTPSTKGAGVEKDPPQYLKNEKCYKPETFRGFKSILQGNKKLQVFYNSFCLVTMATSQSPSAFWPLVNEKLPKTGSF